MMGKLNEDGMGIPQNYTEAIFWYQKAAGQNDSSALYNLGHLYLQGKGTKKDEKKALEYFTKAAESNSSDAQFYLAGLYHKGQLVTQNSITSKDWYTKACQQDHKQACQALALLFKTDTQTIQSNDGMMEMSVASGFESRIDKVQEIIAARITGLPAESVTMMYVNGDDLRNDPLVYTFKTTFPAEVSLTLDNLMEFTKKRIGQHPFETFA